LKHVAGVPIPVPILAAMLVRGHGSTCRWGFALQRPALHAVPRRSRKKIRSKADPELYLPIVPCDMQAVSKS
jgi:hypothetical protein